MQKQIQRALDLVRRTGDKMVVVDEFDPSSGYVVMSLKDYEKLVDKAEDFFWQDDDEDEDDEFSQIPNTRGWADKEPWERNWEDDPDEIADESHRAGEDDWEDDEPFETDDYKKENDFYGMPEESDFSGKIDKFQEIPTIDMEDTDNGDKLDNYGDFDTINEDFEIHQENRRKRWEISPDIKETSEFSPELEEKESVEDEDRYYLETI